ncbi:MAG TPA: nucleotidyltransferase family protein [Candidatus Acidoferrales bacterium]|jgi:predicted nucleotidyltransferase|nr:nucleotidyltransferase family protein [Candidatus Acidoferrales bacterium]
MAYTSSLLDKKAEIAAICRRHHVRELSLFGSAVGPEFRPDSDVDLLVEFDSGVPVGLLQFGELQAELETLLHRRVDLVSKRGLRPLVRERILEQLEPLYAG